MKSTITWSVLSPWLLCGLLLSPVHAQTVRSLDRVLMTALEAPPAETVSAEAALIDRSEQSLVSSATDATDPCEQCTDGEEAGHGDLWSRPFLTGDIGGLRSSLAEQGITFNGDVTQFYMGVAHGGIRQTFNYAGHGDYRFGFDFDKLINWRGLSLLVRAEHRFGEILASDAGVLSPADLHAATPTLRTNDLILTNILFTQVVNESLTVMFGKLDTLDGDRNPFASGRGKTQFLNTSLAIPTLAIPTVPLATLGAGAVFTQNGLPVASLMVLNASDTTTTSGFDELFADGVLLLGNVSVPIPIAGKMGIHTFSAVWSSKTFTSLGQDPRVIGGNIPIARTRGSWVAWWSGAQYLYQNPSDPMKGWGLFGRVGASDGNVNPVQFFANVGIGGASPLRGRENDRFGVGWFYNGFSGQLGPIATTALGVGNSSQGVELYYNYAVTPYLHLTPDLQVIEPGSNRGNTALVVGLRAEIDL